MSEYRTTSKFTQDPTPAIAAALSELLTDIKAGRLLPDAGQLATISALADEAAGEAYHRGGGWPHPN